MFLNIDHNKPTKKLKLHLAKPNKEIISIISEKYDDKVSVSLGGINELDFSIPYFVEDKDMNLVRNEHTDLIKEKMLIRANIDNRYEWFVVDDIDEDGGDNEKFTVKCFSLGTELSNKLIDGIKEDGVSLKSISNKILENTHWKIGSIALKLEQARRSIELDETNGLDSIIQIAETYGAVLDWNTENRIINFLDIDKIGVYKGLSVDYGRLLKSITKKRTVDELTTRLHVYGAEDISIYEHNPSGTSYLEDFSYFMYPFERDTSRKVIRSSYYMSDSLCHALLDQKQLVDNNSTELTSLRKQIADKQTEYIKSSSLTVQLGMELGIIRDKLDVAKASGNAELQSSLTAEYNKKNAEFNSKKAISDSLNIEIKRLKESLEFKQYQISSSSTLTQSQIDELKLFVIEKKWKDDRYIDSKELYDDAIEKFREIRQPKIVVEIDMENLLEIVEEQVYWDRLVLGDKIKVKYPYMNIDFMARIMAIEYDFSNKNIKVTISNSLNIGNEIDALADSLYKSNYVSSILTNNKYKWDKTEVIEDEVYKLINAEYDATKRKILAGINNSVEIGGRGIIVRNPDFPDEMVIMQSGVVALSKNNGDDWQTAITPNGVIAERIIGNLIIGRNLVMTNGSNSLYFDNDGMRVHVNAFKVTSGSYEDGEKTLSQILDGIQYDINGVIEEVGSIVKVLEDEILLGINAKITEVDGRITEVNTAIQTSIGAINLIVSETKEDLTNTKSLVQSTVGKINLLVSETNGIKGTEIASSIALTPSAIEIISDKINIEGKVTFKSFGQDVKNEFDIIDGWKTINTTTIDGGKITTGSITVDKIQTQYLEVGKNVNKGTVITALEQRVVNIGSDMTSFEGTMGAINKSMGVIQGSVTNHETTLNNWRVTGKTTINGANIETGTILASKIAVGQLVVGQNVTMGSNATISWNNIDYKPTIPTKASDIGGMDRSTYIDSNGIFTGGVYANQIYGDIVKVGNDLSIGSLGSSSTKFIRFNGQNLISDNGSTLKISAQFLRLHGSHGFFEGNWDFSEITSITGLTASKLGVDLTAKFG